MRTASWENVGKQNAAHYKITHEHVSIRRVYVVTDHEVSGRIHNEVSSEKSVSHSFFFCNFCPLKKGNTHSQTSLAGTSSEKNPELHNSLSIRDGKLATMADGPGTIGFPSDFNTFIVQIHH